MTQGMWTWHTPEGELVQYCTNRFGSIRVPPNSAGFAGDSPHGMAASAIEDRSTVPNFVPTLDQHSYQLVITVCERE